MNHLLWDDHQKFHILIYFFLYHCYQVKVFWFFRILRFCLFCSFCSSIFLYLFLRLLVRVFLLLLVLWSLFPLFPELLAVFVPDCLLAVLVVDLWFLRWVRWRWSGIRRCILLFLLVFFLFLVLRRVLFLLVGLVGICGCRSLVLWWFVFFLWIFRCIVCFLICRSLFLLSISRRIIVLILLVMLFLLVNW